MKLITVTEMKAIEREADQSGWSYADMMERAGQGLAEMAHSFYGYADQLRAIGLVGSGNNGGDTLIALEALAEAGWEVVAYIALPRKDDDVLVKRVSKAGGRVIDASRDAAFAQLDQELPEATVLLDGVLGTGVRLPLKEEVSRLLAHLKASPFIPPVIAVDYPSGVDCDTGEVAAECLPAEVTVCMAAVKTGLLKFPAYELCGDIQAVDIGLPEHLPAWEAVTVEVVSDELVREILPRRPADGHKGTFGTVTVVGGSANYSGAPALASLAAGKVGAGLVQTAVPAMLYAAVAGQNLNATWVLLPNRQGAISGEAVPVLLDAAQRTTAMLVGPGFGLEDCSAEFIRRLLEERSGAKQRGQIGFVAAQERHEDQAAQRELPPMVIDADGLKLLAGVKDWPPKLPKESVLTPHPGEMSILTELPVEEIQADRLANARSFAQKWGHVVVLKGAFTVVAHPDGRLRVIPVATSALAHAGTGDVLAGMIAGLRAQGISAFDAATAGCWLHAQAGLAAADQLGHEAAVQATDVLAALGEAIGWVWSR